MITEKWSERYLERLHRSHILLFYQWEGESYVSPLRKGGQMDSPELRDHYFLIAARGGEDEEHRLVLEDGLSIDVREDETCNYRRVKISLNGSE